MFLLLISIRYEHGGWWPNLPESNFDHVGSGPGLGYNCNIPLNKVSTLKSFEICYFSVVKYILWLHQMTKVWMLLLRKNAASIIWYDKLLFLPNNRVLAGWDDRCRLPERLAQGRPPPCRPLPAAACSRFCWIWSGAWLPRGGTEGEYHHQQQILQRQQSQWIMWRRRRMKRMVMKNDDVGVERWALPLLPTWPTPWPALPTGGLWPCLRAATSSHP